MRQYAWSLSYVLRRSEKVAVIAWTLAQVRLANSQEAKGTGRFEQSRKPGKCPVEARLVAAFECYEPNFLWQVCDSKIWWT